MPDGLTVEELRQHRAEKARARGTAWRAPLVILVSDGVARVCTRGNSWDDCESNSGSRYDPRQYPPALNEYDRCGELGAGHMFAPAFATLAAYEEEKHGLHQWSLFCVHTIPSGGVVLPRTLSGNAKAMRRVRLGYRRALARAERASAWLVSGTARREKHDIERPES